MIIRKEPHMIQINDPENRELLYEGKAKKVYILKDDPTKVVMYFKNDATAFNNKKKDEFEGKGELNCWFSALLLKAVDDLGIPTHFIEKISDREILALRVGIVPLEVIVRNVAAGTFCKRYGVESGTPLKNHIVEFCVKDDDLGDPPIARQSITALDLMTQYDLRHITDMTEDVNKYLRAIFYSIGLTLVDFKLEFGRAPDGKIYLADEITPDTMRLWDHKTNESLDKDLYRFDKGDLLAGYREVKRRLERYER